LGIGFSNDVLLLVTMITAKIFFRYDSKVSKKLNLCCAGGFKHGNKESVIPIRIGPAKHYERSAVTIYVFIHFKCMAMKSWLMGL